MSEGRRKTRFEALSFSGFRYYLLGAFVSSIGTWLQAAALMWLVEQYKVANDTLVAIVNMATWMPVLFFGLFSGAIADHFDKRRTILFGQYVMMACALAIGIAATAHDNHLWILLTLVAIGGTAYAFFVIAWVSSQPSLVSHEALRDAVALNNGQFNLARFVGPLVAGLVLAWWAPAAFFLNAGTFAFFIVLIYVSKAKIPSQRQETSGRKVLSNVTDGFRYVAETGWMLKALVSLALVSFFGISFMVLIPAVSRQLLHVQSVRYGVLFGMTGLGAVIGMPSVSILNRRMRDANLLRISAVLGTGLLVAFSFSHTYWLSCVIAVLLGASFLVFSAGVNGMVVSHARPDMHGRVSSMWVVAFLGVYPLGGLLLGAVTDFWNVHVALLVGAAGCGLVAIWLLFFPVAVPSRARVDEAA